MTNAVTDACSQPCTCNRSEHQLILDVSLQLARVVPKVVHTIEQLVDMGKWLPAHDLLVVILQCKQAAELRLLQSGYTLPSSWQLHDALLACTIFGFLPPIRLSCIRTLLHPSYKGPCPQPDCTKEGCRGNRLIIVSKDPLVLTFHLVHHKNEKVWGHRAIAFTLPESYAQLVMTFIGKGHKVCSNSCLTHWVHLYADQ